MDEDVPDAAVAAAAAAARALMRVPDDAEAGVVEAMARTAIGIAERFCGQVLVPRPAGSWAAVPAPVAHGVAMLVQHLFEQRGGGELPPAAVAALWRPYRRARLR